METLKGVDIYIDREKDILFIGMNVKITPDSIELIEKNFSNLGGYKAIVFESINEIKFLN